MKSLMLLNPRRKSRKTRKASRKARRRTRRTVAAAPAPKRRRVRRSRKARKSQVFKARGSSVMLRVNPRRRSFRRGRSGSGSASVMNIVRDLGSKETLMLAGGAIGATAITTIITSRFANSLPGMKVEAGKTPSVAATTAYVVGIPVLAAFLVRRWSPALAKGLLIGAAAQGINALAGTAISNAVARLSTPSTVGEYLNARPVGEYLTRNRVGGASYDGIKAFGPRGVGAQRQTSADAYMTNDPAFRASAWETPSF